MRIAVVYGTRPEAVKLKPLVDLLPGCTVLHTGQHQSLAAGILKPTVSLDLPSNNDPNYYTQVATLAISKALWELPRTGPTASFYTKPPIDLVVVQGDTMSAYAGAKAASEAFIPVAHVEAGVRSHDFHDPWPEENLRYAIDRIATYAFCATPGNVENLEREGFTGNTYLTGNTGIDALYQHTQPLKHPYPVQPRVIVTLHRRESFGEPLRAILTGLLQACDQFPGIDFLWPVHPNPRVQEAIPASRPRNLHLLPPLDPFSFQNLLSSSRAVLTDSGGVQEEAAALGIPCVIARNHTDRPESVENCHALLAGTTTDSIRLALRKALTYQLSHDPSPVFGDGHAAPRIAQVLLNR